MPLKAKGASPLPYASSPFTRGLETRVLRSIRRHQVFRPGERVLVAVSGGQDSLALLLILSRLQERLEMELASLAHFDHRLRSKEEAAADEEVVRGAASRLGLPMVAGSGDVRRRSRRKKESIEEAARHMRYAFLGREARRTGVKVVALGHTQDDRAETVLLHLLRGSGLNGLVGLRQRSVWPFGRGPQLARPLLEVTRKETLRYCREVELVWREDPTNLLLDATRNRVRHEVMPTLRRLNPRLDEALSRLGAAAASTVDYLEAEAEAEWRTQASLERDSVIFRRRTFEALHPALRYRLLRRAVRHLAGPGANIEAVQSDAVEGSLVKGRGSVSLPGGLAATVGAREVRVGTPRMASRIPETSLSVPGRTLLPGWTATAEIVRPPPSEPRPRSRFEAWLDAEAVGKRLSVRSRRAGDRLRPLGLGGEKKLQDVLTDAKVPREERDGVPLVYGSWGIVWVVGYRLDERAALRKGSRVALHVRFRRLR